VTDEASSLTTDLPTARPGPPPLRIYHLLVCTVVTAVLLTQLTQMLTSEIRQHISATNLAVDAIGLVISAAGLTLGTFSCYWRAKGYAAFSQPGQWLLAWFLYEVLASWSIRLLNAICPTGLRTNPALLWGLSDLASFVGELLEFVISCALPAIIYFLAARRVADTRPWRLSFILMGLGWCLPVFSSIRVPGVASVPRWVFVICTMVITALLVTWAAVDDRVRQRPRYWTHWVGALLFVIDRLMIAALELTTIHPP
jgi:hypothetical protein